MQFNYKKDVITVNTSSLCYMICKCNSDLNRVSIEIDNETGRRMFVLKDSSVDEFRAYKEYINTVKVGGSIFVDIIQFNHIYSCLKQMVRDFKYNN